MVPFKNLLFCFILFLISDQLSLSQLMPRAESSIWNAVVRSSDKKSWTCSYCGNGFAGNSYRVKCHFIGGPGIGKCSQKLGPIPQQLLTDIEEEFNDKKTKALTEKRKFTAEIALSPSRKQLKITDQSISDRRKLADRAVARCIYSNGLAFHLADNEAFRKMCQVELY